MGTKIEVFGRVQGVNLRRNVKDYCEEKDLEGYVANRHDGSVLIIINGSEKEVDDLISFVKSNPGLSRVDRVVRGKIVVKGKVAGFQIVRSGNLVEDQKKAIIGFGKNLLRKI